MILRCLANIIDDEQERSREGLGGSWGCLHNGSLGPLSPKGYYQPSGIREVNLKLVYP